MKMVPGSTRCRPSTRMSPTVNGSTAQAADVANSSDTTAQTARIRKRLSCIFEVRKSKRRPTAAARELSKQATDVIEERNRHQQNQHGHTTALQALCPGIRHAAPGDSLPKIIHQVPTIEHRQR